LDRKLAIRRSIVWTFLVVLAMAVGFVAALSFAGIIAWPSPTVMLFSMLATMALVATQFSLCLGGGMTKAEREAQKH
jgi:Tfp pilus assembly protein PilO